jgi:hypothetical protein
VWDGVDKAINLQAQFIKTQVSFHVLAPSGGDYNNWYESVVDKKDDVSDDFNPYYNRYVNIPLEYETRVSVSYDPDGESLGRLQGAIFDFVISLLLQASDNTSAYRIG